VETGSRHAEKLRYRGTRGGFAGLASGGRGLQRSRGRTAVAARWEIPSLDHITLEGCVSSFEF
jgi:hypothetical protein